MEENILEQIQSPQDLRSLTLCQLKLLSQQIRDKIITTLSQNGGHLSSNLGIVEITLSLHKVFNSPKDKFIFDTSHQCYTHKLLTGRNKSFNTLRQYNGLCGFTHPNESLHDTFFGGHAGTAFSQALGLAKNRSITQEKYHIIPILGDASFTCGLTLEALNNLPKSADRMIVVLNDNKMSISQNVGNITSILSR